MKKTKEEYMATVDELMKEVEVPKKYRVDEKGIFAEFWKNGKCENIHLSPWPLVAKAQIRNQAGENWQILLQWIDKDGDLVEKAFAGRDFAKPDLHILPQLLDQGYNIEFDDKKHFLAYLQKLNPKKRMRQANKLGWYDDKDGKLIFVLPTKTIGESPDEPIHFMPASHSPTAKSMTQKGTMKEWQENIAQQVAGNPILVFCLSAAFVGPLLKLTSGEGGGFNIHGRSSQGKTTALQVAASVWGNGAAPSNDADTFVRAWKATSNALEGIAAAHNDSIMLLDELGMCVPNDFKKIVYDLAGGQGKSRMGKNTELRESASWRNIYLSTGEVSAKTKMEEVQYNRKENAKAGQLLRLMDIPIEDKIITNHHDKKDPADFAEKLKIQCGKNFGWAGPAFVEALIREMQENPKQNIQMLETSISEYKDELIGDAFLEPEQKRALTRLAMVTLAGCLACQLGILPFDEWEVRESVGKIKDWWIKSTRHLSDAVRAVKNIHDFITKNKSKFPPAEKDPQYEISTSNQAGYRIDVEGETLYAFNPVTFKIVCGDVSPTAMCQELRNMNLLHIQNKGRNQSRFTVSPTKDRETFYAVKADILALSFDE